MQARGRFTRHVLRITVPAGIPRLAHAGVRPVGVEAPPVVAGAGTAGAFDDVFSASGAGEARGAGARVAGGGGVVGNAPASVAARLRRAVVFVGALGTW